jgi:hypothetical protein
VILIFIYAFAYLPYYHLIAAFLPVAKGEYRSRGGSGIKIQIEKQAAL